MFDNLFFIYYNESISIIIFIRGKQMKSKTKFTISIVAIFMIAIFAITGIILAFAAGQQTFQTNISVKYKASQIEGSVYANYYVADNIKHPMQTADKQDHIDFHADDPDDASGEKSLNPTEEDIELSADKRYVVFEYIFNNGAAGKLVSTNFAATLTFEGTADNINLYTLETDEQLTDFVAEGVAGTSQIKSPIADPTNFTFETIVNHKDGEGQIATKYVYVKAEIDKLARNSTFSGDFNWNLELDDTPANGELFDTSNKTIYKKNLNKLIKKISPTSTVDSYTKLGELADKRTTASQINAAAGEDIVITLGGLKWTATYLSKDDDGNIILTLWLDNCIQDAWKDRDAKEGEFYGFINGGLYSDWSANWSSSSTSATYPANMYGTSYIRAVTLNNGGVYATGSSTTSESWAQSEDSVFRAFTMEKYGLTQYLVTPSKVSWQKDEQHAKKTINFSYDLPNDNWSDEFEGEFYSDGYNYAGKSGNNTWANDYLWLPSMTETGNNGTYNGLWQTTTDQRKNANGSTYSSVGSVGASSGDAYNNSWLRSGGSANTNISYDISSSGSFNNSSYVDTSYAVRPAFHLNLTAILNKLNGVG